MTRVVNNEELSHRLQIVFANSDAYHVELPMVGREAQTAELQRLLTTSGPRQASMQAPLGAGKTFFLNTVLGQHMRNSNGAFDELRNRQTIFATAEDVPDEDGAGVPDDIDAA